MELSKLHLNKESAAFLGMRKMKERDRGHSRLSRGTIEEFVHLCDLNWTFIVKCQHLLPLTVILILRQSPVRVTYDQ